MLKKLTLLFFALFLAGTVQAQRAKIVIESVSPQDLTLPAFSTLNSVSSGLRVVPVGTYAYFSAKNITGTDPVLTYDFSVVTRPSGSTSTFSPVTGKNWVSLLMDQKGTFQIKLVITTAKGTDDTTISVYSSSYVGVGDFEGVAASYPNCMSCHASTPAFAEIFSRWKDSKHGTSFKTLVNSGPSNFGPSCYKCHTTGTDKNLPLNNGGFDDVAASLGWSISGAPAAGKWEALKTNYSGLVNLATIECETCHGAGSAHTETADKNAIHLSIKDGVCAACHDLPPQYDKFAQWKNSKHGVTIWSSSFAQTAASQNNSFGNCIRCHDGVGYLNFTKGKTTNTTGMIEADHEYITCSACHDPHGNGNYASLRAMPAKSDTLGNGFSYNSLVGRAETCLECHKSRKDAVQIQSTNVSSTWGPHHSTQSDVFLGQNAYKFDGNAYATTSHASYVTDACVSCHMQATTDSSDVNHNQVGGHTFRFTNPANGYVLTKVCEGCHGPKTTFDDFKADADYDKNGKTESIQTEVKGLVELLKKALPHRGVDTVDYLLISKSADSVKYKKAYWNLQIIDNDASYGMHNAKFVFDVLTKTLNYLDPKILGIESGKGEIKASVYTLAQNFPNPFNPSTHISFTVPKAGAVKVRIYDVMGNFVNEVFSQNVQKGAYTATWSGDNASGVKVASGVYFYKLEASDYTISKKMLLMK